MIVSDGHARKQHATRLKPQASPKFDIAIGWQGLIESASGYERRSPVCCVSPVDVRSPGHVRVLTMVDVPRAKHLEIIDEIAELGIEIRVVMPDDPPAKS